MASEHLTQAEFDAHLAAGTLRLAFVGMSNAGKSYRAKVLGRDNDFLWHQVDGDIEEALGMKDEDALAAWLGYPSSEGYAGREQQYLALEERFTRDAAMSSLGKNLVFDTTGSVVHLSAEAQQTLRDNTLVVHLDVGEESLAQLLERYFKNPKPVAWDEFFTMQTGESADAALRRSYPLLLAERLARYRALAHVNVPALALRDKSGEETLASIKNALGVV